VIKNKSLNDLTAKLSTAIQTCKDFMNDQNYIDEDKINVLQPLLIPIQSENSYRVIEDFCLNVDLILGDTFKDAKSDFNENIDDLLP
jgi:hypothetical protein